MPIENYTGTMQVDEIENGRSEFTWNSTFDAAEGAKDDMIEALENLYTLGVEGVQQMFSD